MSSIFRFLFLLCMVAIFTGCHMTAQSYNYGKILDPGDSKFTFGCGGTVRNELNQSFSTWDYEEDEKIDYSDRYQNNSIVWWRQALAFRLGIHDKIPFTNGFDIGFHLEGTYYRDEIDRNSDYYWEEDEKSMFSDILPMLDIDIRMGLPSAYTNRFNYNHMIGVGWTVGSWKDNGWFIDYAGGFEFKSVIPYYSLRALWAPTNVIEDNDNIFDDDYFTSHNRHFAVRGVVGCALRIKKIPVIPDYIIPEMSLVGPNFSMKNDLGFSFQLGFQWVGGL